uniref:(northern house mosquito) hypothetical protein n=1 Tax=Culex pipiens TaxID=7175 RepID=A0A8D8FP98_CULPI
MPPRRYSWARVRKPSRASAPLASSVSPEPVPYVWEPNFCAASSSVPRSTTRRPRGRTTTRCLCTPALPSRGRTATGTRNAVESTLRVCWRICERLRRVPL